MTMYKEDGSQWYNYFHVRKYNDGVFYVAWNGTTENAYPGLDWPSYSEAKFWIAMSTNWRDIVNERFEKDFLKE